MIDRLIDRVGEHCRGRTGQKPISVVGRLSVNCPGDRGSISG